MSQVFRVPEEKRDGFEGGHGGDFMICDGV